jgi:hypothetical protein
LSAASKSSLSQAPDANPHPSRQLFNRRGSSPAPILHRGIYSLARAGPSIISAWEVCSSRAHALAIS